MGRRITFLRNANTLVPAHRPGTEEIITGIGLIQARDRRKLLGNPEFDLIITSTKPSTHETARIIAGVGVGQKFRPIELPGLLPLPAGPEYEALERLTARFAGDPLSAYYAGPQSDVGHMKRFGARGWSAIESTILTLNARDVLVIGHSVYNVSMAHYKNPEMMKEMMNFVQIECGGFIVVMNDDCNFQNVIALPKS